MPVITWLQWRHQQLELLSTIIIKDATHLTQLYRKFRTVYYTLYPVLYTRTPLSLQAMEMKAEGKYVARGLSFRDTEFSELTTKLTPEQARAA
jgi:hypothetical protein